MWSTISLKAEEVQEASAGRTEPSGMPVLNDDVLIQRKRSDCLQQPVERRFVRSDADEDHASAEKTLPAKRAPRRLAASSGHCA